MPRGLPDFGVYERPAIAEQAFLKDDFEAPSLKWYASKVGTGETPVLSTTTAFKGVQCVYLNVPKGTGAYSYISRVFPLLKSGKVGIEFWVQGLTISPGYLRATLSVYDGVSPCYAELRYDTNAKTVSIWTTDGLIEVATGVYMTTSSFYFLPIKLVIDMDTDKYVRLLVGDTEYDISDYSMSTYAASTSKFIQPFIYVIGSADDNMHAYIDNFILTQNEP